MTDKKAPVVPQPVPDPDKLQRPPESPDFAAPPEELPDDLLEEDPFETPLYEPPVEGEGP
ncbi:MAG TPA: hypothetical protein PKE63_12990 [Lacibacter sp.]|nr:hypothetical protein [Lacibacter sp.]HMO89943.1 hypothetical protein [Lacibacter sp.]HMP88188.1 hypothetical protein [Lacibacter sp.]